MKVIFLEAVYKSKYDDYPSIEKLGVFTTELNVQKAISAYEAQKYKYHAEHLLVDTTYVRTEFKINEIKY